ncbi:Tf2-9, partial [Mucuna pruriens]
MFPYVIKYKKGKENIVAFALSRRHALLTLLYDGFLFKKNKLCVPTCSLREMLVRETHGGGLMGHFRVKKTLEILRLPKSQSGKDYIFVVVDRFRHFWRTLWNKLGTKLLFSTIAHPQTNGKTEVINRTLATLIRAIIQKNLKIWEKCLLHVEFAYNRTVHSMSSYSPFEITKFVKELHAKVRANIEKKNEQYSKQANKGCVKVTFELGDWVWVHMRKERFPIQRNSKLKPRGDGPFQVLERIIDNAYKLDLPTTYDHISSTFNVADLSLFDVGEEFDSRMNPIEEGRNDRNPTDKDKDNLRNTGGPMTRSKTKTMKQSVAGLSSGIKENLEQSESECWFYWKVTVRVTLSLDNFGSTDRLRAEDELS